MKWLAAIGVAFPLLVVVAIQMIPVPVPVQAEERFDEAWQDNMRVIALRKADTISTAPRLVVTERVAPDAPVVVPPVAEPPEAPRWWGSAGGTSIAAIFARGIKCKKFKLEIGGDAGNE